MVDPLDGFDDEMLAFIAQNPIPVLPRDDDDDQRVNVGSAEGVNEVAVDPAGQPGFHGFFTAKPGSGKVTIAHV